MKSLGRAVKTFCSVPPVLGGTLAPPPGTACFITSSQKRVAPSPTKHEQITPSSSDLTLSYVSYENPEFAGSQTPLVLQHGLFARKENFKQLGKQLHHLTKRSLVIPDVRNHGASPTSSTMSLKQMSGDLVRLVQQLGGEGKACLLGHATGGRVAMVTALQRPDLVDRLVVVSSSPVNTVSNLARWERIRQACYVLHTLIVGLGSDVKDEEKGNRLVEKMRGVEFKLEANEALKSVLLDNSERALFLSTLGRVNVESILNNPELGTFPTLEGHTFPGPTMFVSGVRDPVWEGDEEVRKIRQLFPNSHFVQLPGAGRWVHTEQQDDFLAVAATFLQTKF